MAFVSLARGRPAAAARLRPSRQMLLAALGAVAALAAIDLAGNPGHLSSLIGDTDDAVRLIEVRRLLAGTGWTDMALPTIGAPQPLLSHWSRLVDAPLAALITLLTLVVGSAMAELATRALWPLLLLFGLCLTLARAAAAAASAGAHAPALALAHGESAEDDSGARRAALIAVALAATSLSGVHQFLPGRIDHHNAMILLTVTGLLLLIRGLDEPRLGGPAGGALALALAIGYEPMALIVAALGVHGAVVLVTRRGERALLSSAIWLFATLAAVLVATNAPADLLVARCDALSLNLVLLAGACASGVWLVTAGPLSNRPLWLRLGGLAISATAGLAAYGTAGPQCLAGPFGGLDPSIRRLLLDEVMETQPWTWQLQTAPVPAAAFALSALIGLGAAWQLWRRQRHIGPALLLATLALAVALGLWQIKLIPYATFLAVVPTAVVIAKLQPPAGLSPVAWRIAAVLAASQVMSVTWAPALVAQARAVDEDFARLAHRAQHCLESDSIRPLAGLPPGLVLAERDLGPYIAALTPHRVVAAPYHRLDKSLLAHDRIMAAETGAAQDGLRALGVGYVAICPDLLPRSPAALAAPNAPRLGLYAALLHAHVPSYLEAVPLSGETPLRVWRLRPPGADN